MFVTQSCPTLCDPIECSLPVSSVHGIFQARILEWVAIIFSRDLPHPGLNSGLLHYRQILYCLSHQGSPRRPSNIEIGFSQYNNYILGLVPAFKSHGIKMELNTKQL